MLKDPTHNDEWERDPAWFSSQQIHFTEWLSSQKKVFAFWCNMHLKKRGEQVSDLFQDFRNGRKLLSLLEILSGEKLPKPDRGNMCLHKVLNVSKMLHFLTSKGVKVYQIAAENIVDGNEKMTLGLI